MKPVHLRRLGGAVAVALTAGLFAAPAAVADGTGPRVTGTTASPQPRDLSAGTAGDACDETTAPGWIGLTSGGPTLRADVASDVYGPLSAAFSVRDLTTGTAAFDGTGQAYGGTATTTVPGLADGHAYAWNARALQGTETSAASPDCHFKLDLSSPQAIVSSTDFPPSGSGQTSTKYAGQTGAFVVGGTDPVPAGGEASGIACFLYAFDAYRLGSGCAADSVKPGPDGSATIRAKVRQWGTNTLWVVAVDNAGNQSSRVGYTFYAPSNPNPPSAPGDVDGDGVVDILLPDAQGNLQYISASANDTTPNWTVRALAAPNAQRNWTPLQVAHRGWDSSAHAPMDDLFIHEPGSGWLSMYRNSDYGAFESYTTGANRPEECEDATGAVVPCPADFAANWSKADQLLAFGPLGDGPEPSLLTLEGGDLWLHTGDFAYSFDLRSRKLTTGGSWTGYDLVAPGRDGAGNLALWARERATGALHAYAIPRLANGTFDFAALADPTAGVVATGFTVDAYPVLGSSGDGDGDTVPDLWAVTADRHLLTYRGLADPKDLGVLN
ncbi:hypothetical protein ABTX81_36380 [Kitasatospora sp. NPDC097605]|uniref:hypothetical protein n=1 Tax=Kitasatospora sp. NPDC097605 TaxID=3157226 RepID=UPI00331835CA